MGGDNAPEAIVTGCIDALKEKEGFDILLIGNSDKINEILKKQGFQSERLKIEHTDEVVTGDDIPTKVVKQKKNSSMMLGFQMLKDKKGDVFVSAGNTGALLTGALFILGRLEGVDRPALAPLIPTKNGWCTLIDGGMNPSCKPVNYLQFGIMGSIYMKNMFNIENPRVGLVNVGSEHAKGNEVLKQAYSMFEKSDLNFVGNIEGNDILEGKADVVVTDGFTGNVLLKFLEGAASFMFGMLTSVYKKSLKNKVSAMMIKGDLKKFKRSIDPDLNGGAPILGINGLVLKSHGSSNAKTIRTVILKAFDLASTSYQKQIGEAFEKMEVEKIDNDE